MSFASEPGRDDSGLPPVNIEIPDDARELARDVLAYRRELRARRRRARLLRILGPLARLGLIRHGTIFPVIATCVAASMLAGVMLSVVTITPASAPTVDKTPTATVSGTSATTFLPDDMVKLGGGYVQVRTLTSSVLVLIAPKCAAAASDCGAILASLASQARAARVGVYFVYYAATPGSLATLTTLTTLTTRYGGGAAKTVYDTSGRLFDDFQPSVVTALLVHGDTSADLRQTFPPGFDLTPDLRALGDTH